MVDVILKTVHVYPEFVKKKQNYTNDNVLHNMSNIIATNWGILLQKNGENWAMELHIGREIKRVMDEKGIQPDWLAQKINTSRRNMYDILQRLEISTGQLMEISKALDYDFFELYQGMVCEPSEKYGKEKNRKKVSVTVELDGLQSTLDYWTDVLKKLNSSL